MDHGEEPNPSGCDGDDSEDANHKEILFRDLVHAHQKRLYRFVLQKIGNGTDAEDITQQAFVEAASAYESYRGASELSTWLYGIAMNLVRNHLTRAPHRRYTFETDDALDDLISEQPDPAEQLMHTQSIIALQNEINDLPEEMRSVLLLVTLDELSYEEAALMLSIPVGTVRSRLSRARSTLKQKLLPANVQTNH
ncbi:MAG: RNA polymerase sigma factor [Polaromonas sp.]|nr:RNA polymerase sigma factor [Polaromonas sp.]